MRGWPCLAARYVVYSPQTLLVDISLTTTCHNSAVYRQEDQAIPRSPSRKEGVRGSTKCSEDMSTSARVSSAKTKGEEEKCPEGGWQDQQTQEILDYARAEGIIISHVENRSSL